MNEHKKTVYKIDESQKKEIDMKMKELLELCQVAHVPMFASCAIANTEEETKYLNIIYGPQSHAIYLHDDKIKKHMLIASGSFDVVLKREIVTFDPLDALRDG